MDFAADKDHLVLSVLMDNTAAGPHVQSEHGLSFLIEAYGKKILLDAGRSAAFMHNADVMGVSLDDVTHIVLSHGHYDHTGGLEFFLDAARWPHGERPVVVCHPDINVRRRRLRDGLEYPLGVPHGSLKALDAWGMHHAVDPFWIDERICFLGEIPRVRPALQALVGQCATGSSGDEPGEQGNGSSAWKEDHLPDDSALIIRTAYGLAVFAGCSHSGIVNIVERARQVMGEHKIFGIYGGLHFKDMAPEALRQSLEYLECLRPQQVFACHCSGDALLGSPVALQMAAGDCRVLI